MEEDGSSRNLFIITFLVNWGVKDMQSELKSKRLILIQSDVSHASDLFAFWTDPEVSKFMNMESLTTPEEGDRIGLNSRTN